METEVKKEKPAYRNTFVERIKRADQTLPAVKLAMLCVEQNIPAVDIAEFLAVSLPTTYSWFTGKTKPDASLTEKIEKLYDKLTSV